MKKELELYLHIPFCVRKCAYCDFLSGPQNRETIQKYVDALVAEIRAYGHLSESYRVTTIFLGGGTPSILIGDQIKEIFSALREVFDISENAEISIEVNPGTVTPYKFKVYREVGINRISFGLQSVNQEELKLLGRIHTFEDFLAGYDTARKCGFKNLNVDLISAIPGQTVKSWEKTLKKVLALRPEHISAYSLIIEEGTPFAAIYGEGSEGAKALPDEDEERLIYRRTEELLNRAGYHRYEISNYAKPGMECRHNLGYWERKDYLGIGLGAASLMENVRYNHTEDLEFYIEHAGNLRKIEKEWTELSVQEQIEEFIFLGLRKMKGISEQEFEEKFGRTIHGCYGENLERLKSHGLLTEDAGYLKLTAKGIDISNYVFAELLY